VPFHPPELASSTSNDGAADRLISADVSPNIFGLASAQAACSA